VRNTLQILLTLHMRDARWQSRAMVAYILKYRGWKPISHKLHIAQTACVQRKAEPTLQTPALATNKAATVMEICRSTHACARLHAAVAILHQACQACGTLAVMVGLIAITIPIAIFVHRALNDAADSSRQESRDCGEGLHCDEVPSTRQGPLKRGPPYAPPSASQDGQFGIGWLAVALCFAALFTLCFLTATLARRHFVRAWKRNDVELWCAPVIAKVGESAKVTASHLLKNLSQIKLYIIDCNVTWYTHAERDCMCR
jgi:hypothetical protein